MSDSTKPVGKSSSSPVGSSQSVSGQQNNSSNNPFPPKPFGTPTPLGLQTGNSAVFRSTPSKASPCGSATQPPQPTFGSNTQQSKPAFGSSIFDFSTPFFASSQLAFGSTSTPAFSATSTPAFGSTSTPAFGATSTPSFGSTSTPAFGATSTPAFGSTSTPAFGATSTPAFGATSTPAFGSTSSTSIPAFGSTSTPAFGSTSSTSIPAFGSTSTPAFGATSTPAFGSTGTPAFGATSTPAFGSTSTPAYGATTLAFSFGSSTQAFCQSSFAFGSQTPNQTFENTSIGQSEFGGQRGGSETDGGSFHIFLSTMSVYKDKSHEELRWEDYQLGTKAFGQSSSHPFGFSHSVFGQQNNSSNNPSGSKPLGLQTDNSSTSAGVFGATQTLSPFSSNTTSSASSSPAFHSSMPASGASSTPAFGLSVFGLKPAFGGFRSTPTQPSPFGSAIQPPQPTFGSNTQQSQPAFGSNIFDSSTHFCASSRPAFGSTSTPPFGATSTPAYGATTPDFSFGSSTLALGQFSSAFGTSSPFGSTTSAFGGQVSAFGHTPTQTFENTGIGQSEFGCQRGGSRVASYSATTEPDEVVFGTLGRFESISSMSIYKDKSHEELRWEDYQSGDKGGPLALAPQSTGMAGFNSSTTQTNDFSPSPIFGQSSSNPFSTTTINSTSPAFPLLQSNVPWLKDIYQRVTGTANFGAVSQLNIADHSRLFTEIFSQVMNGLLFSGALIHDGGILSGTSVDELSSLRARVKHLEGEFEKTLLREETLKKEVKAMGELKSELSMANEDLANARKKITALGEQNGSLTEKVTTLDAQNETLSEKVKTLEEHKKSLSEKIGSLELAIAEHGDPAVLKKELAEARDALASKDTTSLDKDEELVNLRNVKASLEKELHESLDNGTNATKVVFEDALRQVEKGLSVELDRSIYKLDEGENGDEDEQPVAEGEDGAA